MAVPLFLFFLGVMEVGFDIYTQQALDSTSAAISRMVSTGQASSSDANFVQDYVCPALSPLLPCTSQSLRVSLTCLPGTSGYYGAVGNAAMPGANTINSGSKGQFMLLQLWYIGPTFLGNLVPGFVTKGSYNHITYSASGFVNELFTGGQTC